MEINYNELFGLEESAKEQEAAEPAQAEETEGVKEQPAAEADVEENTEKSDGKQTENDNSRFAAARRKAEEERDRAVAQARADAQRQIDEAFATSGLTNPYTGQPITTKAQYDEYKKQFEADREKKIASGAGMSDEEFKKYIENRPEVREARRIAAESQAKNAQAAIDAQLAEIGKFDANIKSVQDLTQMDNYPEFYAKVKAGYSLVDAYKLVNMDRLINQQSQAAAAAEEKKRAGKEHLSATSSRGSGAQTVPDDVMAQYKLFMPNATEAEIREHYNKHHQRKKE